MSDNIETVSGFMASLQKEIEDVKSGKLSESTARVVAKFRNIQLNAAALNLQYQRMIKGKMPLAEMPMLLKSEEPKTETKA